MTAEDALQISIVEYLKTVAPQCEVMAAVNHGKRTVWDGAKQKRMGLTPGAADLSIAYPFGRIFYAEIKTDKGKLSMAQVAWAARMRNLGHTVALWRSVEDARNTLKALGIETREAG